MNDYNNKYPIYIISKGRYDNPITAKYFKEDGLLFKVVVEPQEYEEYCKVLGVDYVLKLPFSNLGMGGTPARNWCWEHSRKLGFARHWIFDDNITGFHRLHKGRIIRVNGRYALTVLEDFTDRYKNIAISGFNYEMFVTRWHKKPFVKNVHVYSGLLIDNHLPFKWRLKYNEDVDLCLNALDRKYATILFNAIVIQKISTTKKMKGGNQDDLYKDNAHEKKVLKARSLEAIWSQYVKTVWKFNRPHHSVNWRKFFNDIPLVRRDDIDWSKINSKKYPIELKKKKPIKSSTLSKFFDDNKGKGK